MPKRRAAPNDDSDEGPSSSAKRARTEEGSDDEVEDVPPTQTQTRVRRAGKGKQRAIDVDVDDDLTLDGDGEEEDVDDEEQEQELQRVRQGRRSTGNNNTRGGGGGEDEDEEDDEQFEAQNGDKIRAKLESKRHVQGVSPPLCFCLSFPSSVELMFYAQGVAEYGIIEYIEMHQFMCHKYLTFHFGPQINFIIGVFFSFMSWKRLIPATIVVGHNGSKHILASAYTQHTLTYSQSGLGGKSAALSALTVALGGKANSTGRGSGIKSFIREGQRFFPSPSPPSLPHTKTSAASQK